MQRHGIDQSKENIERLTKLARQMRLDAIDMAASVKGGAHLGGGMSAMEILAALYGAVLNYDVTDPLNPDRDRFLASKSHVVLAQIPALAAAGFIPHEEILEFQKDGGRLTGYPGRPEIGLEYSGGSLGMAISVGIGIALACREQGRENQVYVLMGDGELNEGSIWEAFMSAAHYHLGNLTAIIDRNRLSYDGDTEEVMALEPLTDKLESFGFKAVTSDGHDIASLLRAFSDIRDGRPMAIIARTIKGKGVSFMENNREWHHHTLTKDQYEQARQEILAGEPA